MSLSEAVRAATAGFDVGADLAQGYGRRRANMPVLVVQDFGNGRYGFFRLRTDLPKDSQGDVSHLRIVVLQPFDNRRHGRRSEFAKLILGPGLIGRFLAPQQVPDGGNVVRTEQLP